MADVERTIPRDIIDWLIACESQVDADGYQQNESCSEPWYVNGPPVILGTLNNAGEMLVEDKNGDQFLIRVTRYRPRKAGGAGSAREGRS